MGNTKERRSQRDDPRGKLLRLDVKGRRKAKCAGFRESEQRGTFKDQGVLSFLISSLLLEDWPGSYSASVFGTKLT